MQEANDAVHIATSFADLFSSAEGWAGFLGMALIVVCIYHARVVAGHNRERTELMAAVKESNAAMMSMTTTVLNHSIQPQQVPAVVADRPPLAPPPPPTEDTEGSGDVST